MMLFSKYFSTPVTDSDRHHLLHLFGLADWEFEFAETQGDQLLRLVRHSAAGPSYDLDARTFSEWKALLKTRPGFSREVNGTIGAVENGQLFRLLFPFPFKALSLIGSEPDAWFFSSENLKLEFTALLEAFQKLEAKLAETELSALRIQNGSANVELLFHFVRKRIVGWAVVPELAELRDSHPSAEQLKEHFGTTAQLLCLDTHKFQQSKLISDLTASLNLEPEVTTHSLFLSQTTAPAAQFEL